jgi:FkbM family methyltransferase
MTSFFTLLKRIFKGTPVETIYRLLQKMNIFAPESVKIGRRENAAMEKFIKKVMGPDSNGVDVGCHMGEILAQLCALSPHGHHVAFEPIPTQAAWLTKRFPKTRIMPMALSDHEGTIQFYHNVDFPAYSGVSVQRPNDKIELLTVPVSPLDKVLDPKRKIHFLKIDVEGAELQVFRGAKETIKSSKPAILFEYVEHASARHGAPADVFFNALKDELGLKIFLIESWLNGQAPLTCDQFANICRDYRAYNFVAFHT